MNNKYFRIWIEDPLKTWRKAKKYFVKPKPYFNWFWNKQNNCPYANLNYGAKILDIWCSDVRWKDKYNTPRYEGSPFIWVCFFNLFGFSINWHIIQKYKNIGYNPAYIRDMYYWEYLLDFLYYRKDINKVDQWTDCVTGETIPTKEFSLK